MSENSAIEWTDHTFNPWVGCTKVSEGCTNCYAETWAKRSGAPHLWQGERRRTSAPNWLEPIRWNREAEADGVRRRVFCALRDDDEPIYPGLDLIIVGGESGPSRKARPMDVRWVETIIAQCRAAGVPVFVKQLGIRAYRSPARDGDTGFFLGGITGKGGNPAEWPEHLRVREMPA